MAITIPSAFNSHENYPTSDPRHKDVFGDVMKVEKKTFGGISLLRDGQSFRNATNLSDAGLSWWFNKGTTSSGSSEDVEHESHQFGECDDGSSNTYATCLANNGLWTGDARFRAAEDLNERIFVIGMQFNAPNRIQIDTITSVCSTALNEMAPQYQTSSACAAAGLCSNSIYNDDEAACDDANETWTPAGNTWTTGRGIFIRMENGDGSYREFRVGGRDSTFGKYRSAPTALLVDPAAFNTLVTGDTAYDPSTLYSYTLGCQRFNLTGTNNTWVYVSQSVLLGTKKDDVNTPRLSGTVKLGELPQEVHGSSSDDTIHVYCATLSDGIYFIGCPFVIGDKSALVSGTCSITSIDNQYECVTTEDTPNSYGEWTLDDTETATVFDDEGGTFISPSSAAPGDPRYHLTNNSMRVYVDLRNSAADSATFSGTYKWGTAAPWDFGQSDSAVITLNNPSFSGMGDFTIGSSVTGTATWDLSENKKVINNGASIEGLIRGDMVLTSGVNLSNLKIEGNLDFQIDSPASITLSNVEITGNVTNNGADTVTLNTDTSVTIGNIDTSSIVEVAAPRTLTFTGLIPNTEVRVYDSTSNLEVAGEDSLTTLNAIEADDGSLSISFNNITSSEVYIVIHALSYISQRIERLNTTEDNNIPIKQTVDRQYIAD